MGRQVRQAGATALYIGRILLCTVVLGGVAGCNQDANSLSTGAPAGSGPSLHGTVMLSWLAPTNNTDGTSLTDLAGYTIHYGTSSTTMTDAVKIPLDSTTTNAYTLQNLSAGVWYFAVAAYTSDGTESALSDVVSTTVD